MLNKSSLKQIGLTTLRKAGAFSVIANSERRRRRLLILCYHGISLTDEHHWLGYLYVTPERFRQRLAILRQMDAHVLPLAEGLERLRRDSLPPRSVVITFDDGFVDFLRHGVPILHEFGYPCTLYLTTHYSAYRVPVITLVLNYILWKSGLQSIELPAYLPASVPIQTYEQRQVVVQSILDRAFADNLDTLAKNEVARSLATQLGVNYSVIENSRILQIMSPDEASETARAGIDIQLHTHRHRTPRNRELFLRELRDNSNRIQEFTGRQPEHFCYPSGDYSMEFLPWLEEFGVKSATTCNAGLASARSASLLLPRVLDDSLVPTLDFESWLSGVRV